VEGSLGLDGLLTWLQARQVAVRAAAPLPTRTARLDEANGNLLAAPLATLQDDPAEDVAAVDGYALCGEGPWRVIDLAPNVAVPSHFATPVIRGEPTPPHSDSVIAHARCVTNINDVGDTVIVARDPLTDIPDERARPRLGEGIVRRGEGSTAGAQVLEAGTPITPPLLALAASLGYDRLPITPPPVVGTLILGAHLLEHGLPRYGRPRDALALTIPAFVGRLGARGNPAVRAPESTRFLIEEIGDSTADLIITAGSTTPEAANLLREVLRDIGAHWLIDGVLATPGAETLLVRLPDGRLLLGLSGDPVHALAGLVTLAPPLIGTLRGIPGADAPPTSTAVLATPAPEGDAPTDEVLVPVRIDRDRAGATASVLRDPFSLTAWASADAIAVVPPGAGAPGDVIPVIPTTPRPPEPTVGIDQD
jgi:molybdopterin molybdotransferase